MADYNSPSLGPVLTNQAELAARHSYNTRAARLLQAEEQLDALRDRQRGRLDRDALAQGMAGLDPKDPDFLRKRAALMATMPEAAAIDPAGRMASLLGLGGREEFRRDEYMQKSFQQQKDAEDYRQQKRLEYMEKQRDLLQKFAKEDRGDPFKLEVMAAEKGPLVFDALETLMERYPQEDPYRLHDFSRRYGEAVVMENKLRLMGVPDEEIEAMKIYRSFDPKVADAELPAAFKDVYAFNIPEYLKTEAKMLRRNEVRANYALHFKDWQAKMDLWRRNVESSLRSVDEDDAPIKRRGIEEELSRQIFGTDEPPGPPPMPDWMKDQFSTRPAAPELDPLGPGATTGVPEADDLLK